MAIQIEKMLRLLFVLMAVLLFPFSAFAGDCDPVRNIPITVTPVFDNPGYDFNQGLDQVQRIAGDAGHSIHEGIALGVTHYQSILEFRTPVVTTTFPNGDSCTNIERVDVTIGYRDVVVYIAREVPQNSCGFGEVLAHEGKHIAVNHTVLDSHAARIRDSMAEYLQGNTVFRGRDKEVEIAQVRQNLQNLLDEMGKDMMDDNVSRQQLVDSPEEYSRLSHVCGGQLARIVNKTLSDSAR